MIEVQALNKSFKVAKRKTGVLSAFKSFIKPEFTKVNALENISFSIPKGEIVGYIGPNGAGKSTTIKIMSGILVPDSGTCKIHGRVPWENRIDHVKNIGVVFGQRSQLWWDVPVIDSYYLLKDIYDIPENIFLESLSLLKDSLGLKELLDVPVRQLSLGQRMRCEIAASLLHNPDILFLDEPTIGLDAVSKNAVRNFIKTLNKTRQTTVILTTHDMSDIEALADRILLIGKGKLLLDGSLNDLKSKYITHKKLIVDYHEYHDDIKIFGTEVISHNKDRLVLSVDLSKQKVSDVICELSSFLDIIDITVEDRDIEDIIIDLYKEYKI